MSQSMVHMRMASSVATQDRGSGMGHQQGFLAAVAGKRRGSKAHRTTGVFAGVKGLILGAVALLAASNIQLAKAGPVRTVQRPCRRLVGRGNRDARRRLERAHSLQGDLCGRRRRPRSQPDPDLRQRQLQIRSAHQCHGRRQPDLRKLERDQPQHQRHDPGLGSNGSIQVVASAAGFNANISVTTRGNRQTVLIKSESSFRAANISLSRS